MRDREAIQTVKLIYVRVWQTLHLRGSERVSTLQNGCFSSALIYVYKRFN